MNKIKFALKYLFSPKYKYMRNIPVKAGDVIIDLGANVGEVSGFFLKKNAVVHAYEPNPFAFAKLKQSVHGHKNAHVYNAAVSNFSGKSQLFLHKQRKESEVDYSQASSLKSEKNNLSSEHVEVDVMDIDTVLSVHPKIRLLKIDIEGGEYDIMDSVLENAGKIDQILLETHEQKYPEFRERGAALQRKIEASPYKDRVSTDWF